MDCDRPTVVTLEVSILNTNIPIWRRILICDNCTFWDANVAIKQAFNIPSEREHYFVAYQNRENNVPRFRHFSLEDTLAIHHASGKKEFLKDYASWDTIEFAQEPRGRWRYSVTVKAHEGPVAGELFPKCYEGQGALPPHYTINAEMFNLYLDNLQKEKGNDIEPEDKVQKLFLDRLDSFHSKSKWDHYDPQAFDPATIMFSNRQ